ncbi:hypothetical protein K456DRAFT_53578 [Colletotrichum gloeosporioides 23]|nr:hypothetical protein K456DRAFT_53578 [Colletotrichum gloeosporioides 23]
MYSGFTDTQAAASQYLPASWLKIFAIIFRALRQQSTFSAHTRTIEHEPTRTLCPH